KDDLIALTRKLAAHYKKSPTVSVGNLDFSKLAGYRDIQRVPDMDVALSHKVAKLKKLDQIVRSQSDKINQVSLMSLLRRQEVEIFNSEGLYASEFRPYVRLITEAITGDGQMQASGTWNPGARGGWKYIEDLDLNFVAEKISKQSLTMLKA